MTHQKVMMMARKQNRAIALIVELKGNPNSTQFIHWVSQYLDNIITWSEFKRLCTEELSVYLTAREGTYEYNSSKKVDDDLAACMSQVRR